MTAPLIHLIYASVAVDELPAVDLAELLGKARLRNQRDGITGMLLYADRSFFQVLEGEADAIDAAFSRIARDPRHRGVVTIIRERIPRRAFAAWTMGYVADTAADVAALAGTNDFFAGASCFDELPAGRAKKVLAAFRAGRWRATGAGRDTAARRIA